MKFEEVNKANKNKSLSKWMITIGIVALNCISCSISKNTDNLSWLEQYNVNWTTQSKNSGESMPVSGGDIGLNVWVEDNELLIYIGRAGYRDENGALLKPGRIRMRLSPNPFEYGVFHQELKLREGHVLISGALSDKTPVEIKVWVDVLRPIVHMDVNSESEITTEVTYENWRFNTIELEPTVDKPNSISKHDRRAVSMINYDEYPGEVFLYKDTIQPQDGYISFYHKVDNSKDIFDFEVKQQALDSIRDTLVNPLDNLIWGGALVGDNFYLKEKTSGSYAETPFQGWKYVSKSPSKSHRVRVLLHIDQCEQQELWEAGLEKLIELAPQDDSEAWEENLKWWEDFWNRSHLVINSERDELDLGWRLGRNYQLFRYMLASNVSGREPSLFNGGLFTFDPLYVNGRSGSGYTPDHRQWGAAFTAQNQRLLVWPLLKTGDFDFFPTAFSYYTQGLTNAKLRVKHYWDHNGCCFEEQTTITYLPGATQYGFVEGGRRSRPLDYEVGMLVNPATRMIYEGQLEYSWLMLQYCQFSGEDIAPYLEFIEQSVIFYDEHYRFRNKQLNGAELDENGKLVIYPSNTLESHPESKNPTSVIAGLKRILTELSQFPDEQMNSVKKERWKEMLDRLPEMPTGSNDDFGGKYLKPSENYEHNHLHSPEMYPLYPYQNYGIGLPGLDLMKNTFLASGEDRFDIIAWAQGNIHAARLGNVKLAQELNSKKMDNGPFRFPAFWPGNMDWAPDHNWGGSGMIGMQEMLMQTHRSLEEVNSEKPGKIRLFPTWPNEWDVDFKLHAPKGATVEGKFNKGNISEIIVSPESKREELILLNEN